MFLRRFTSLLSKPLFVYSRIFSLTAIFFRQSPAIQHRLESLQPISNLLVVMGNKSSTGDPGSGGGKAGDPSPVFSVGEAPKTSLTFTEEELKERLTEDEYRVTQQKGTERAWTGKYVDLKEDGTFNCVVCSTQLFKSEKKFESGSGWPSFSDVAKQGHVHRIVDDSLGMVRTEVVCGKCGAHLGHIFEDGPKEDTGLRYCINSASLKFDPNKNKEEKTPVQDKETDETPVQDKETNETPVQDKETGETPVQDKDTDETPVQDKETGETPVQEKDMDETPIQDKKTDETPVQDKETDVQDKETGETPIQDKYTNETPIQDKETDETPVQDEEADETPVQDKETD